MRLAAIGTKEPKHGEKPRQTARQTARRSGHSSNSHQNGVRRSVPRSRRMRQISRANSERRAGGVAWMTSTAAAGSIASDWPFIASTAVTHCASVRAPSRAGLRWCVRTPKPARFITTPTLVLQERQAQARLRGALLCSFPSTWCTSTLRVEPQNTQTRGPTGAHSGLFARYRAARSVTVAVDSSAQ